MVEPLALVQHLCDTLVDRGVRFCHWKSNAQIGRSETARNDLDLLVSRDDVAEFGDVLARLRFVRTVGNGDVPGIESFVGFDAKSGRLVHAHAHYRLVLGHDTTKNYRLPIEDAYIASSRRGRIFPLPCPEFELIAFVTRMVLKHCVWDELAWCALRGRRPALKRSEREELSYLQERADAQLTIALLREQLPFVDEELFAACRACLADGQPARARMRTARRLERALEPWARHSPRLDALLRLRGRLVLATRARSTRLRGPRLPAGGRVIGVIGGDGAGKSTAVAELHRWLSPEFDVRSIHLGKPHWSATTYVAHAVAKAAVASARAAASGIPCAGTRRLAAGTSEYRALVWLLCTARDRRRTYRAARRFASDGGIVISDRYPYPRLTLMDVPQIARVAGTRRNARLVRAMAQREQRYHDSIRLPELLVGLRLDPEIAVERKRDEPGDSVRARGAEIWAGDWDGAPVTFVDASRPATAVAAELKELVWEVVQ